MRIVVLGLLCIYGVMVNGQSTIGVIDFDGSSNYIGYGISGTADSVSTSYTNGNVGYSNNGLEVKNNTVTLTSNAINTSSFSNISLQFRLASLTDTTSGGGSDVGDSVTLWISLDNGSTWSAEIKISGRSNARWSYSSGLATALAGFDGNGNVTQIEPTGGGDRTSDGYSIVRLNSIPSISNLRFRISLKNGTANEIWAIDDLILVGTSGNCTPASDVSSASTSSHSFSLDAKWTNSSCYDEVVVFMNETSGIQVSPSGTYGSYFGNSVYTTPNQCVYNGVGDSIRVTGLDNGTTYYFEIFTRRNSTWSSGVEVSGTPSFSGITFSTLNSPITIDFDSTLAGCNNGAFNGSGFSPSPSSGQLNSSSWSVTGFSDGNCFFDSTKTAGDFARGTTATAVGTGGIYSFQINTGDYALGVQPVTADFTPGEFLLRVANETGSTVTNVLLNYEIYIRNDQGKSNSLNVAYSIDGVNFETVNSLNSLSKQSSDTLGWRKNKRVENLNDLSIPDNSFFYLKWIGDEEGGSGTMDEFALDNLQITFLTSNPSTVTISSSSLESLKASNLTITLGANLQLDSITLANSILSIDNNNLSIVDSAFIGNDSSYINTNGSGRVTKSIKGPSTFTFPVGRTKFSPITLQFTTVGNPNGEASVRVIDSIHAGVTASSSTVDYIKRFWNVTSSGITSFSCNVSARYHDSDIVGTEGNLFMGKWDGTVWDVGSSVSTSNNLLSITGVTSFSDFTGAGSPLLPVEWLYFYGERKEGIDFLHWATANEFNNKKFIIEKSFDNVQFSEVDEVLSKGNSLRITEYNWQENASINGTYYRLKQEDFDGKFTVSSTIYLSSIGSIVTVFNTTESIVFRNNTETPVNLTIFDMQGKNVLKEFITYEYFIAKQKLRAGMYVCKITSEKGRVLGTFKIVNY